MPINVAQKVVSILAIASNLTSQSSTNPLCTAVNDLDLDGRSISQVVPEEQNCAKGPSPLDLIMLNPNNKFTIIRNLSGGSVVFTGNLEGLLPKINSDTPFTISQLQTALGDVTLSLEPNVTTLGDVTLSLEPNVTTLEGVLSQISGSEDI